jgi:hypothetical protein
MEQVLKEQSTLVRYTRHPNGIHEFVFLEATKAAVDHFFVLIEAMMAQNYAEGLTAKDTVPVLVDFRTAGMPSMNYLFQRGKIMRANHDASRRPLARVATLFKPSFVLTFAQTFGNVLMNASRDKTRLFADETPDKAIAWLLQKD